MARSESCSGALAALTATGKHVCVGLDTDISRIPPSVLPTGEPADRVVRFNAAVIEATADVAASFKPNIAFYEALGRAGFDALARTIGEARRAAPDVPIIVDAKRGDIGSTNSGYITAIFDELGADGVTVHPYLGREALAPFLKRTEVLIFVLARTSNPGAGEFQDLEFDGLPLYRHVARAVAQSWNRAGNCGLVVGATYPRELTLLREDVPSTLPFLIPGIGAQGGDLEAVVSSERAAGSTSFVVNASRSILYASSSTDFAEMAGIEAQRLHDKITALLTPSGAR